MRYFCRLRQLKFQLLREQINSRNPFSGVIQRKLPETAAARRISFHPAKTCRNGDGDKLWKQEQPQGRAAKTKICQLDSDGQKRRGLPGGGRMGNY